jgi:hypothetical protein
MLTSRRTIPLDDGRPEAQVAATVSTVLRFDIRASGEDHDRGYDRALGMPTRKRNNPEPPLTPTMRAPTGPRRKDRVAQEEVQR